MADADAATSAARLIAAARTAARHAYAPYSRFAVGAAVLLDGGDIVTGANFENASYGLSLCAETVALAGANTQGRLRDILAVAVAGGAMGADGAIAGTALVHPCGRCRQMLAEAGRVGGRDILVHLAAAEGDAFETRALSRLLPDPFGPAESGFS